MNSVIVTSILKIIVGINIAFIQYPKLFLKRSRPKFKNFDQVLLDKVACAMSENARKVFESQIKEVNMVEWHTNEHTHIYFSKIKPFYYDLNRICKFEIEGESNFLSVFFEVEGKKYLAKFFSVYGNLFSIEFNNDIRDIANKKSLNIIKLTGERNVLLQ